MDDSKKINKGVGVNEDILDLPSAIQDCHLALNEFLNNRFTEAKLCLTPNLFNGFYYAHVYSVIKSIEAILAYDPLLIEKALKSCRIAAETCNKFRKNISMLESMSNMFYKVDYDSYTEENAHAELCYAESQLFQTMLMFLQDGNFVGLVKCGLKIKSCYQSYQTCSLMLKHRTWKNTKEDENFMVGVLFGQGVVNVIISMMPPKVLKLLKFIGFAGSRSYGLEQVIKAHTIPNTLRGPFCTLFLSTYHLFVTYVFFDEGDLEFCRNTVQILKKSYPNGVFTLLFLGRVEELSGNFNEAIKYFKLAIESQKEWQQLNCMGYYGLFWCHAYNGEWREACKILDILLEKYQWFKACYAYLKAVFLLQVWDDLTNEERSEVDLLMKKVPGLRQKVAGHTIPQDKFVAVRAIRYGQNGKLVLPFLESSFILNGTTSLKANSKTLAMTFLMIDQAEREVEAGRSNNEYYWDEMGLVLLLKGMFLKGYEKWQEAENCFRIVCEAKKKIISDTWLIPFTMLELGKLLIDGGQEEEGLELVETARGMKGYSMETRFQMKVNGRFSVA